MLRARKTSPHRATEQPFAVVKVTQLDQAGVVYAYVNVFQAFRAVKSSSAEGTISTRMKRSHSPFPYLISFLFPTLIISISIDVCNHSLLPMEGPLSVDGSHSHLLRALRFHSAMLANVMYILRFISIEKKCKLLLFCKASSLLSCKGTRSS